MADAFVEKFAAKAKTLCSGDPRKGNVVLGSLISTRRASASSLLIDDALAKGATLVAGGAGNGTIMPATIVDHVTPAMRIYGEESFGPVVTVVRVSGVEEAVRVANDTEYGLASAVFGRDIARALSVAKRIESRHLPRQCTDRARRAADAVRRYQGVRLWPFRRQGSHRRVHRAALDYRADRAPALPVLRPSRRPLPMQMQQEMAATAS